MAGKLDYVPGVFRVERHVHGERTCGQCETIVQAPKAVRDIDKGIPNTRLLTQVLMAKHADHQPLYRQEAIRRTTPSQCSMRCTSGYCSVNKKVPEGAATAKALGYSMRRRVAITRFVDDG